MAGFSEPTSLLLLAAGLTTAARLGRVYLTRQARPALRVEQGPRTPLVAAGATALAVRPATIRIVARNPEAPGAGARPKPAARSLSSLGQAGQRAGLDRR